jgi:hypothetical protein
MAPLPTGPVHVPSMPSITQCRNNRGTKLTVQAKSQLAGGAAPNA